MTDEPRWERPSTWPSKAEIEALADRYFDPGEPDTLSHERLFILLADVADVYLSHLELIGAPTLDDPNSFRSPFMLERLQVVVRGLGDNLEARQDGTIGRLS